MSWNAVSGASWYEIWRSQGTDFADATLLATSPTTTYNDTLVTLGTHYYYWITAWRVACTPGSSRSAPSGRNQGTAGGTVPAPTGVTAVAECGAVQLSWTAPSTGAFTYTILRHRLDDDTLHPAASSLVATSWTDQLPIYETSVEYIVIARSVCGSTSPQAASNAVTAHGGEPLPVLQLAASDGTDCRGVFVQWDPAPFADLYQLLRNEPDVGTSLLANNLTQTNYLDTTAVSGVVYSYRVRPINTCGASFSGDDNGHFVDCPPDTNCSGELTVQDIFDFLALYFSSDLRADFNNSGTISVQDIFDFLAAYFAGCP